MLPYTIIEYTEKKRNREEEEQSEAGECNRDRERFESKFGCRSDASINRIKISKLSLWDFLSSFLLELSLWDFLSFLLNQFFLPLKLCVLIRFMWIFLPSFSSLAISSKVLFELLTIKLITSSNQITNQVSEKNEMRSRIVKRSTLTVPRIELTTFLPLVSRSDGKIVLIAWIISNPVTITSKISVTGPIEPKEPKEPIGKG